MPLRFIVIAVGSILSLAACRGYDFRVNDTVVYTPDPLFSGFEISDPALYTCVKQVVIDLDITAANQLTSLNCSHAGIEDLTGLGVFTGLQALRLSSNRIRNLVELAALVELEELYLDDNRVVDPVPLYLLAALQRLDLSGNPALQCPRPGDLDHVEVANLPEHCRGSAERGPE